MNKSEKFLVGAAIMLALSGCVSSTSGPPQSEPDDQDASDLNYQLGARYFFNGDYDLARDRLELSLEQDPDNAIAWSTLGLTYEAIGNMRLAEESFSQAVKVAPRDFQIQDNYATFLCRRGRPDDARKYFDKAIRAPTNDFSEKTFTNAGVCMMQKPDYTAGGAVLPRCSGAAAQLSGGAVANVRPVLSERRSPPRTCIFATLPRGQRGIRCHPLSRHSD